MRRSGVTLECGECAACVAGPPHTHSRFMLTITKRASTHLNAPQCASTHLDAPRRYREYSQHPNYAGNLMMWGSVFMLSAPALMRGPDASVGGNSMPMR